MPRLMAWVLSTRHLESLVLRYCMNLVPPVVNLGFYKRIQFIVAYLPLKIKGCETAYAVSQLVEKV